MSSWRLANCGSWKRARKRCAKVSRSSSALGMPLRTVTATRVLRRSATPGSALRDLLHDIAGKFAGVVARRRPAVDRLLQNDFLDVVGGEALLSQRRTRVDDEFFPLAQRDHCPD